MGVNFTPSFVNYTGQGKFRFWCQSVLPLVYDDSLSYMELLNKMVIYLNRTIQDVAAVETNVDALLNAYNQLQQYVNDYFDNLDVQDEINIKLDGLVEDGTMDKLLEPFVTAQIPGLVESGLPGVVEEQIPDVVAGQIDDVVAEQINDVVAEQIPKQVTDWLGANVTPVGSAVIVDNSLTISGAAADAKAVGDALTNFAPPYSSSDTYAVGDYVLYNNVLYRCNTPISTAEAWTGTHWKAVKLGPDVADLNTDVAHVEESVFCITIDPSDNYVPFTATSGDTITIKPSSGDSFSGATSIGFYDSSKKAIANLNVAPTHGYERTLTITLSRNALYVRLTPASGFAGEELIIINKSNETYKTIRDMDLKTENTVNYSLYETVNRDEEIISGSYIRLNDGIGNVVDVSNPTASVQYSHIIIPCHAGDTFLITATGAGSPRAWGFTDNNYILLSVAASGASPVDLLLSATVDGYFISNHDITKTYALTTTQLFKAVSETKVREIIDEVVNVPPIVVDASGNGDYTSFTLACKENYNNSRNIVVKPGTYDIVSEYVDIWGQSAVDSMADADGSIFDGWQYGVKMTGRKFVFEPGAKLVCDWTGHTADGTHRFSALRVEMDVEIEGLDLDCTGTFYAIHDDYGVQTRPYTVKYKKCKVIGHSLSNADCIGGGCKKWSRHIIEDCYFDNNLTNSATVRYHNTNFADAVPEIYVSNTYFNNWFTPRWYGSQTSKMRVYVNNCHARAIYKVAESSSYDVDNVELYKWNNEETDPRT